jgi:DNA-binding beta-propeller fold protein YncE
VPLPGCDHDHGLALDPVTRLAFVACDGNATLLTVALDTWQLLGTNPVVEAPDVLAFDPAARRLYVAGRPADPPQLLPGAHRLTRATGAAGTATHGMTGAWPADARVRVRRSRPQGVRGRV